MSVFHKTSVLVSLISVLSLIVSCGSPPKPHEFENTKLIDATFDDTWESVIQFFATNNVPIKTLEKESGIIAAENQYHYEDWMDCGKPSLLTKHQEHKGAFNVFVREVGAKVSIQVNTNFTCNAYMSGALQGAVDCYSTGEFETDLLEFIQTRVNR